MRWLLGGEQLTGKGMGRIGCCVAYVEARGERKDGDAVGDGKSGFFRLISRLRTLDGGGSGGL